MSLDTDTVDPWTLLRQKLAPVLRWIAIPLIGCAFGGLMIFYISTVGHLGHNIPAPDLSRDYLIALTWAIGFGISIPMWPVPARDKRPLLILWITRCLVTLGFMLFYESYYGLDAFGYFHDALSPEYDWSITGFGSGTGNLGAVVWIINHYLPIGDSYHAMKICFSMMGLVSTYFFYRAIVLYTETSDRRLLYLLGFFPSLLFWSSILGKDPVIIFGIALYCYGALSWIKKKGLLPILFMGVGIVIASWIRSWLAFILVVPMFAVSASGIKSWTIRLFVYGGFACALVYVSQLFLQQFGAETATDLIGKTHEISRSWNFGGSSLDVPELTNLTQMLKFAPLGMFTALFRPLPGEVLNPFGLLAGLENVIMLWLLALAIKRFKFYQLWEPAVVWATSLVLVWSFIYGFVSFQNLGSAFRFRLQILPILLPLLLYLGAKVTAPAATHDDLDPDGVID